MAIAVPSAGNPPRTKLSATHHVFEQFRACFPLRTPDNQVGIRSCNVHNQVDSIGERTSELRPISLDCGIRATTSDITIAEVSTRTRIARGYELKPRGEREGAIDAYNADTSLLNWLPQHLKRGRGKLTELIQIQNAAMRQADLTRMHGPATANQTGYGNRVVRAPKRPLTPEQGIYRLSQYRVDT